VNKFAKVPLSAPYDKIEARRGVSLAIRPQYMRIESGEGTGTIPLTVFALEHLGNESILIADAPDESKLRAVVAAGFEAKVGEVLHVSFDPGNALLFDKATERQVPR
jgi:ABC-type sugar transport system ATPase subunit